MKKIFLPAMLAVLFGCADLSKYTTVDSNASAKTKMRACMVSEANNKFQAGTLFSSSVSVTADEIVNTCIKKLALQSAGISEESQSTAQTFITNLKKMPNQAAKKENTPLKQEAFLILFGNPG